MEKITVFETDTEIEEINQMFVQPLYAHRIKILTTDNSMDLVDPPAQMAKMIGYLKISHPDKDYYDMYGEGKSVWLHKGAEELAKVLMENNVKFSVSYVEIPKQKVEKK